MTVPFLRQDGPDLLLNVKAVPNASRDAIAGILDDRLKIRIAAPPEAGRANTSICRLLAKVLGVKASQIEIDGGHASAHKTLRIRNFTAAAFRDKLQSTIE
ncbi:MAG: DUF167 domain-containing protein [Phycisphaerales bacterium]|nr:DUF167 domain-containing protein [Phycisphaerales bacterium]